MPMHMPCGFNLLCHLENFRCGEKRWSDSFKIMHLIIAYVCSRFYFQFMYLCMCYLIRLKFIFNKPRRTSSDVHSCRNNKRPQSKLIGKFQIIYMNPGVAPAPASLPARPVCINLSEAQLKLNKCVSLKKFTLLEKPKSSSSLNFYFAHNCFNKLSLSLKKKTTTAKKSSKHISNINTLLYIVNLIKVNTHLIILMVLRGQVLGDACLIVLE